QHVFGPCLCGQRLGISQDRPHDCRLRYHQRAEFERRVRNEFSLAGISDRAEPQRLSLNWRSVPAITRSMIKLSLDKSLTTLDGQPLREADRELKMFHVVANALVQAQGQNA